MASTSFHPHPHHHLNDIYPDFQYGASRARFQSQTEHALRFSPNTSPQYYGSDGWPNSHSTPMHKSEMLETYHRGNPPNMSFSTYGEHATGFDDSLEYSRSHWTSADSEYFISNNSSPVFSATDTGSPLHAILPGAPIDDLYSSPSGSEDYQNVFDITFGQSLTHRDQVGPPPRTALSYDPSPPPMTHAFEVSMFHSPSPRDTASRHSSPTTSETSQSNDRRRFPCLTPGCSRRFTSQYTLRVHMEAHKPKSRVTFPCTLGCKERFSRQHDRLRHEVAKHGKICEHLCDECGRFFSTKKTLGNHKCPLAQGGTRWVHNN